MTIIIIDPSILLAGEIYLAWEKISAAPITFHAAPERSIASSVSSSSVVPKFVSRLVQYKCPVFFSGQVCTSLLCACPIIRSYVLRLSEHLSSSASGHQLCLITVPFPKRLTKFNQEYLCGGHSRCSSRHE